MIKEKQYIETKSSSFSSEGDPSIGDDNQMIKTPDNNSGELHHDLDRIIKTESDMTALIDNAGGDVADNKSGVGGNATSNTSPGSSNTDQKQQLMSNDICLSQIKHEDTSNNSGIKVEDNNTTSTTTTTVESDFESCDRVVLSSMNSGSGGPSDLIDGSGGVQPLMSNVLGSNATGNKQSNTTSGNMDAQQQQYMQQQSQIFVFSTSLANKSAESVLAGQYPTIIAYHCAQPRTKKFLEKHPLKVNQFNRQNPGQWMNNVVASQQQMKHQQQLNKGMAPHGGQPKYGGGTPYSRSMKNSNSPSGASIENPMMQQQPGARMPMWNHHQGNNINDSGPQQLQHSSNHNMMGSMCGPGNNGIMGMSNHSSGGSMGPGMLMNSNNSNQSMMGAGPGSMMNQHGNLCSMGPGSGGGMPMNGMDLDLMDHHNPHHQQHHPNPHHPSNMMDGGHRPMMGGGPHHPHHPPPHHPSGALHHRGPLGMGGPPHHHGMSDMMTMGGPNKCQPSSMDSLMSSSGGPPVSVPSGPGDSPGGHNSLASMMPSLDFDDPIGSGNSSLGATSHHSLTGVQVPDENLTPQQRQHREEQQATLRKLQLVLFPENSNSGGGPSQQQPPPVTSSSSSVGGPLDNCSGSGGMDDLMPSIDDDLDVDAVVTAAAVTSSAGDLLLPPKTPTSCSSDWPKSMFGNEDEKKKDGGRCGPPPSYHQTVARSASVPIVSVPSCSPNSPLAGNGTGVTNSNLSLPSPRTCSALNSPAGGRPSSNMSPTAVRSPGSNGSRLQSSNPGTPVHMSPGHNSCSSMKQQKGPMSNEFSPSSNIATPGQPSGGGQQSPDGLFCHSNKQLSKRGDEPNLMPVPSPQHIQYLNTFDGQELTIQKQPNTGLKDSSSSTTTTTSTMSPSVPTSQNNMDMIMTDSNMKSYNIVRPGDMPLNPSAAAAAAVAAGLQTSQHQPMKHFDPISSLAQMNQQLANNVAGGGSSPIVNHGGGVPSLHHPGGPGHHHPGGGMMSPFGGGGGPPMHMMGSNNDPMCGPMGMGSGGMHDSGMGGPPGSGGRMMYGPGPGIGQGPPPPGPNGGGMSMGPGGGLPMGMPPIGGGRNGGMMMNSCVSGGPLSPKSSSMMQQQQYQQQQQQRLMPRIPAGGGPGVLYNGGANIQVKPSAPNTIQYLPNNSRGGGPRGAPPPPQNQQQQQQPGLDFLQRFSGGPGNGGNSLSNLDGKVPTHNLQYFPNSGGGGYNNSNGGAGINDMMCGSGGPPGGGGMGGMPPGGPNNSRGMMRGSSAGMIRLGSGNNGMGMSGSNYNGGPSDNMFGGGGGPLHHPPSGHPQQQQMMMMGGGSGGPPPQQHKGGGMMGGPGPPDATQPLPPSMGGGGGPGPGGGPVGFRGGPPAANSFIGPTTADPNYAQQFHNFQQQLYATNTRGGGGGGGPSGPGGGGPQQFFVSK
ncbi:protein BCL9 homolog [Rhopalosiphum padi]|uniref:protein BCL9 homolog n=1 Tax=Rhopalosiphum padi TaxID=40932 RepID=UPI00298E7DDA|nr:protein BCL9 homolog [Rhopalosiphum padi]